jgi:hypothetical protein
MCILLESQGSHSAGQAEKAHAADVKSKKKKVEAEAKAAAKAEAKAAADAKKAEVAVNKAPVKKSPYELFLPAFRKDYRQREVTLCGSPLFACTEPSNTTEIETPCTCEDVKTAGYDEKEMRKEARVAWDAMDANAREEFVSKMAAEASACSFYCSFC